MFRAFLQLTKQEIDEMTIDEYMDYVIMFKEALKFRHAPFMKQD